MKIRVALTLLALALVSIQSANAQEDLQGTVEIDGSSTVAPISVEAADMFSEVCPKVKVPVGISGTGGGFKRFTKGETDISDASRPIKKKEFDQCKTNGIQFIELPVAYDGLTIIVSKENDFVKQLTVDQLKKIFRDDMKVSKWSEIQEGWPDTEIGIFAPGTDSGTFDYFKEVMVGKEEAAIRSDMSVSEDDNIIVTGVSESKSAIGFLGAAYYFENMDKLRAVAIVNSKGDAVLPSAESIESGEYAPFSRPLFIYINAKSANRPEVKTFVNHYLENAADIAEDVGYVGLPEEMYDRAQAHFDRRITGTHFLSSDGEKRSGSVVDLYTADSVVK